MKLQDVTLVSHGSVKKLAPLIDQVERWQGPVSFCHLSEQSYRNCRLLFVPTRQGNTVAVRTHIHPCGGGETRWPAALPSECGPEPSTTIHRIQLFLVDGCRLFCHQGGPTGGWWTSSRRPRIKTIFGLGSATARCLSCRPLRGNHWKRTE